jgi:hypothetical protein
VACSRRILRPVGEAWANTLIATTGKGWDPGTRPGVKIGDEMSEHQDEVIDRLCEELVSTMRYVHGEVLAAYRRAYEGLQMALDAVQKVVPLREDIGTIRASMEDFYWATRISASTWSRFIASPAAYASSSSDAVN